MQGAGPCEEAALVADAAGAAVSEAVVDVLGEQFGDRGGLVEQEPCEFVHSHAVPSVMRGVSGRGGQVEAGRRGGVGGAVRADRGWWRRRGYGTPRGCARSRALRAVSGTWPARCRPCTRPAVFAVAGAWFGVLGVVLRCNTSSSIHDRQRLIGWIRVHTFHTCPYRAWSRHYRGST